MQNIDNRVDTDLNEQSLTLAYLNEQTKFVQSAANKINNTFENVVFNATRLFQKENGSIGITFNVNIDHPTYGITSDLMNIIVPDRIENPNKFSVSGIELSIDPKCRTCTNDISSMLWDFRYTDELINNINDTFVELGYDSTINYRIDDESNRSISGQDNYMCLPIWWIAGEKIFNSFDETTDSQLKYAVRHGLVSENVTAYRLWDTDIVLERVIRDICQLWDRTIHFASGLYLYKLPTSEMIMN